MKKLVIAGTAILFLSGCVSIFMPKKQKITIVTNTPESTVYVDKEEFGTGSSITARTRKDGSKQLVVKTPGYKDQYSAIVQTHRSVGYWVCLVLDLPFVFIGIPYLDAAVPKGFSYDKVNELKLSNSKTINKGPNDKYIDVSAINVDIKNKNKDINGFYVKHSANLYKDIETAEKERRYEQEKAEKREAKKKKKKKLPDEDVTEKYELGWFTNTLYKTLRVTGYIDTVNRVFADNNNTLVLEANIKKYSIFMIGGKTGYNGAYNYYKKAKLFITWNIKNTYGEILDSVETVEYSGDFVPGVMFKDNFYEKLYGDAVENSYMKLHKSPELVKHLKMESDFSNKDPMLSLSKPAVLTDKADAASASVIVKVGKGHGSGFVITNDGYIVTNYHVVAGRLKDKPMEVKVITSEGEELAAKVVRYNKYRDLALLKVDKKFNKVFKVSSTKSFKNMQTVYTVGAPKSVELGQSIASGVISNERKNNNNNLLQLGMSVNAGNSGGPLFDDAGNLHGVIVSKLVGQNTEGVSFAVPGYLLEDYLKINFK
jgi:uncharacterized protein YceK